MENYKIIYDDLGQSCNRFWSYLDTFAWAISNKKKVYVLYFDRMLIDYDRLRNCPYIIFPLYNKFFISCIGIDRYIYLIDKLLLYNKIMQLAYKKLNLKKMHFIEGWPLRGHKDYFPLVMDDIKAIFQPNEYIRDIVHKKFDEFKDYFVIGVHIRRGDYRTWMNGKYYIDDNELETYLDQLLSLYPTRKVVFFIASNEPIPEFLKKKFKLFYFSKGSATIDLYALSLCDRIFGPLSTFSRWASFIGNVPLYMVENKKIDITSDDFFSPIKDYYHYENGIEISL